LKNGRQVLAVAAGAFVLGLALGLVLPRLFNKSSRQATPPPSSSQETTNLQAQFEHAIREYETILEKDPQNAEALVQLGTLYYGLERFEMAEEKFKQALKIKPENVDVLVRLGNLYYDTNRPQEALRYYQQALKLNPKLSDVRVDMATMYRRLGKADEALKELRRVIADDPQHAVAYMNLGIILRFDKGDYKGAIKAWEDFLRVAPKHPQADRVRELLEETRKLLG